MDIESRERWVEFSKAKDEMFRHTDIDQAPWYTVEADDKRRARLNCIAHILDSIDYGDVLPPPLKLGRRPERAPVPATSARPEHDRPVEVLSDMSATALRGVAPSLVVDPLKGLAADAGALIDVHLMSA